MTVGQAGAMHRGAKDAPSLSRIERAFQAAITARAEGATLGLDTLCGHDVPLRAEVESLLRHFDEAGGDSGTGAIGADDVDGSTGFLNPDELHASRRSHRPALAPMLEEWGASALGQRVGGFTLLGQIGAGGMAVVFLAEQDQPRRQVALKLIRRGSATPAMIRRFEREGHFLGRLNHPGIAQVYAAGVAEIAVDAGPATRAPYIAMEWVDGPTILDHVRQRGSRPALALELVAQVCDAIQHAHHHGVIHRDLKPANILVAVRPDGTAQAKVLDFGVALQAADAATPDVTRFTHHGYLIGTLAYMSPEQVRSSADVDARCDVYALGAILYQILSDRLPVDVSGCPLPEAARRIVEATPPKLGALDRTLRGDVETIVAKALEKDPARRYQSPAALARDIRHHLAGEPIEARHDSLVYQLRKQAARYRTLAVLAAIVLAAVSAIAVSARRQERMQTDIATAATAARAAAEEARRRTNLAAANLAEELSATRLAQGRLLASAGDTEGAERVLWDEWFERPNSLRVHWALWELYARSRCRRTIMAHPGDCRALSIARDGSRFATGGDDAFVRLWSFPDGAKLGEFDTGCKSVHAVGLAPDGSQAIANGDGGSTMIDLASGTVRKVEPSDGDGYAADYAPNGLAVAIGSEAGVIRLFDPKTLALLCEIRGDDITTTPTDHASTSGRALPALRALRFDPRSKHLAAMYVDGRVKLWQVEYHGGTVRVSPGPRIAGHEGYAGYTVDFSADGTLLGSGGAAGGKNFRVWRVADGSLLTSIETKNGTARSAAFSPDGAQVAVTGYWRTQVYDLSSGEMNATSMDGGGFAAAYSPDGRHLLTTGSNGTCHIWDMRADPTTVLASTSSPVHDVAAMRVGDECRIAMVQDDGQVRLHVQPADASAKGQWRQALSVNVGNRPHGVRMTPDGQWLVIACGDGSLVTLGAHAGQVVQRTRANAAPLNAVRIAPDGKVLATAGQDGSARLWLRTTGGWAPGAALPTGGEVLGASISADGRVLVTTSRTATLCLWSIPDGRMLRRIETSSTSWVPAFSSDGRWLVTGAWDRSLTLWDARPLAAPTIDASALRPAVRLMGHTQLVLGEAFDPGGEMMASVASDGTLRLWDLNEIASAPSGHVPSDHRRCLATLDAGAGPSTAVAFLRDGADQWVIAGYQDGSVRITDLRYFDPFIQGQVDYQRHLRAPRG